MNSVVNVLFGEMVSNISTPFAVCDLLKVFLFFFYYYYYFSVHDSELRPAQWWLPHQNFRAIWCTASLGRVCFKYEMEKKSLNKGAVN